VKNKVRYLSKPGEAPNEDRRLRTAGVPTAVLDIVQSDALFETEFTKYVKEKNWTTLILSGGVGSGKTVAACLRMDNHFAENPSYFRHDGLFVDASDFARINRYDQDAIDKLAKIDFLIIDDLGIEFADTNGNFLCGLLDVVTKRCRERKHTIITTNLNRPDFERRYDARILDRITETGAFCVGSGKSLRRPPLSSVG
jgi:DNA replication protein DnaC